MSQAISPQKKAESLGVKFAKQEPGYLAMVVKTGNLLITSGHVSDTKGKLGAGLSVEEGKKAARECAEKILNSIWNAHGTLDGLRVIKVLGCVNSTLEFHEQHLSSMDVATYCMKSMERQRMDITLEALLVSRKYPPVPRWRSKPSLRSNPSRQRP